MSKAKQLLNESQRLIMEDKEIPATDEILSQIDFKPLETELSNLIGTNVTLTANVVAGRRTPYIDINSNQLADKSGVFKPVMSSLKLTSFGSWLKGDDATGEPIRLSLTMAYSFNYKSGGSNGQELLNAQYMFATKNWAFKNA